MPVTSTRLGIPIPLGPDTNTRANRVAELTAIENNAGTLEQDNRPFYLRSVTYDSVNTRLVLDIGPGRASYLNSILIATGDTVQYINTPAINTTYYLFLQGDGTFSTAPNSFEIYSQIAIWQINVGASLTVISLVDLRSELAGFGARNSSFVNGLTAYNASTPTANSLVALDSNALLPTAVMPPIMGSTTFTGPIFPAIQVGIQGGAGTQRYLSFSTLARVGTVAVAQNRWVFATLSNVETGSDTGSDFVLQAFHDNGILNVTPISIPRATGLVQINNGLQVTGDTNITGRLYVTGGVYGSVTGTVDWTTQVTGKPSTTGTGNVVYSTTPTISSPTINASNNRAILVNGNVNSLSGIAIGQDLSPTLVAQLNGDTLYDLFLGPTFNDNGKTGVTHYSLYVVSGNSYFGNAVGIGAVPTSASLTANGGITSGTGNLGSGIISQFGGMTIQGATATQRVLTFTTGTAGSALGRWGIITQGNAESTADAGSDFAIQSYHDNGTAFQTPITITRSTGTVGVSVGNSATIQFGGGATYGIIYNGTLSTTTSTIAAFSSLVTVPATTTGSAFGIESAVATAAASFTLTTKAAFHAAEGGHGTNSNILNSYGIYIESMSVGSTGNYGLFILNPSGASGFNAAIWAIGGCIVGSPGIANAATQGFTYITQGGGIPSGTPLLTGPYANMAPMRYDTSTQKLWIYDAILSAWKSVVLS